MMSPLGARRPDREDYQRLILDDLLYYFRGPYAMLTAFLDESGTHGDSPVMCVGGFLFCSEQAKLLDDEWKKALDEAGIDCFHAKDYAKRIAKIGDQKEDELYKTLVALVKKYARGGAVVLSGTESRFDDVKRSLSWEYSQYTTCAYACVSLLSTVANSVGEVRVDIMLESGEKDFRELDAFLAKLEDAGLQVTHGFRRKKDLRLLQTADLWAYEVHKRFKDTHEIVTGSSPEAPVRLRRCLRELVENNLNVPVMTLNADSLPALVKQVRAILQYLPNESAPPPPAP